MVNNIINSFKIKYQEWISQLIIFLYIIDTCFGIEDMKCSIKNMTKEKQLDLMKVLEMTEDAMCYKYEYHWENLETLEIKPEYQNEYDKYYLQFWNIVHNTNYLNKDEINNE